MMMLRVGQAYILCTCMYCCGAVSGVVFVVGNWFRSFLRIHQADSSIWNFLETLSTKIVHTLVKSSLKLMFFKIFLNFEIGKVVYDISQIFK